MELELDVRIHGDIWLEEVAEWGAEEESGERGDKKSRAEHPVLQFEHLLQVSSLPVLAVGSDLGQEIWCARIRCQDPSMIHHCCQCFKNGHDHGAVQVQCCLNIEHQLFDDLLL